MQLASTQSFHLLKSKTLGPSLPPLFLWYPTCNPSSHFVASNLKKKKKSRWWLVFIISTATIMIQARLLLTWINPKASYQKNQMASLKCKSDHITALLQFSSNTHHMQKATRHLQGSSRSGSSLAPSLHLLSLSSFLCFSQTTPLLVLKHLSYEQPLYPLYLACPPSHILMPSH